MSSRTWIPPVTVRDRCEEHLNMLLWQVRGEADLVVRDEEWSLVTGHASWIPAGASHSFTVRENSVTVPLGFDADDIATTLAETMLITVGRDLRTLMLAYMVSRSSVIQPPADIARQILALIEHGPVLSTALPAPTGVAAGAVCETLRFNPGDARTVEQLSASVHTTTRTLQRAFLAETGMTMQQWRLRNRMEAAAFLLRSTSAIDAVAHRVGYSHVNSFRRAFSDHFGLSPTRYAKRYGSE